MAKVEYENWIKRFTDTPKTTDDCYTPPDIYEAVVEWVLEEYTLQGAEIVRPFYPGGDYQEHQYPAGCAVVDNPPFSILSQIIDWYRERDIKYFLFAPGLSLFSYLSRVETTVLPCDTAITYANGAKVSTGFVTNMTPGVAVAIRGELQRRITNAQESLNEVRLAKIDYPENVTSGARITKAIHSKSDWNIPREECEYVRRLDAQRASRHGGIYGTGIIVSDRIATLIKSEERERERDRERGRISWPLSVREEGIVKRLNLETRKIMRRGRQA